MRPGAVSIRTVVVAAVAFALIGVVLAFELLAGVNQSKRAQMVRDRNQLRQIATALVGHTHERRASEMQALPAADHAALYSMLLKQNLFSPELLVSPAEANPMVRPWTPGGAPFAVDLATGSNTSYALPPLDASKRFQRAFTGLAGAGDRARGAPTGESGSAPVLLMCVRGPREGIDANGPVSSGLFGRDGHWAGGAVFGDLSYGSLASSWLGADQIFRDDSPGDDPATDNFMVIQRGAAQPGKRVTADALSWD